MCQHISAPFSKSWPRPDSVLGRPEGKRQSLFRQWKPQGKGGILEHAALPKFSLKMDKKGWLELFIIVILASQHIKLKGTGNFLGLSSFWWTIWCGWPLRHWFVSSIKHCSSTFFLPFNLSHCLWYKEDHRVSSPISPQSASIFPVPTVNNALCQVQRVQQWTRLIWCSLIS